MPLTAQTTGFHTRFCFGPSHTLGSSTSKGDMSAGYLRPSFTSTPVQNARLPAARSTTALTWLSSRTRFQASWNSLHMVRLNEFMLSGRLMVMVATPSLLVS